MAFHVGYMGYAKVGSTIIKITGSSLNPAQAINAPELVQGEYNKRAWNFGPIETGGNITGPCGDLTTVTLASDAWDRDNTVGDKMANTVDVEIYFYKATGNSGRKFAGCNINSYALSVTAGDVATFTADFFGTAVTPVTSAALTSPTLVACEKLITWDKCGITAAITGITDFENQIQGWSLNINNNLKRIYNVGQKSTDVAIDGKLFPVEILAGIRDVTGSITLYADTGNNALLTKLANSPWFGADAFDDYNTSTSTTFTFTVGTAISIPLKCTFARAEMNAMTDTMTYTLNFTGLCNDYSIVIA
jgi:hypothetical protein